MMPDFLRRQLFVAFDSETTGMWAPVNRIVELAAVKFSFERGQIDTFQALVNPERSIPADVIAVHGITDEMVRGCPFIKPVLERFVAFCGDHSVLIAHNAPFDISFVGAELDRVGLDFPDNRVIDTVDIYHRLFPGLESYSLLNIVRHFKIAQSQEHRALSDAMLVYRLFEQACAKFPPTENMAGLLDQFAGYHFSDWRGEPVKLSGDYSELQRAVDQGLRVEIDYNHPVASPTTRVIHPQQVHQLGSVYYINAYCERAQGLRTFRLDRIKSFRLIEP